MTEWTPQIGQRISVRGHFHGRRADNFEEVGDGRGRNILCVGRREQIVAVPDDRLSEWRSVAQLQAADECVRALKVLHEIVHQGDNHEILQCAGADHCIAAAALTRLDRANREARGITTHAVDCRDDNTAPKRVGHVT